MGRQMLWILHQAQRAESQGPLPGNQRPSWPVWPQVRVGWWWPEAQPLPGGLPQRDMWRVKLQGSLLALKWGLGSRSRGGPQRNLPARAGGLGPARSPSSSRRPGPGPPIPTPGKSGDRADPARPCPGRGAALTGRARGSERPHPEDRSNLGVPGARPLTSADLQDRGGAKGRAPLRTRRDAAARRVPRGASARPAGSARACAQRGWPGAPRGSHPRDQHGRAGIASHAQRVSVCSASPRERRDPPG